MVLKQLDLTPSVQSLSPIPLCDPMDCNAPGLTVHHQHLGRKIKLEPYVTSNMNSRFRQVPPAGQKAAFQGALPRPVAVPVAAALGPGPRCPAAVVQMKR